MTDDEKWAEWEKEHREDLAQSEKLIEAGHNRHCAYGIIWGSGTCTCKRGMEGRGER